MVGYFILKLREVFKKAKPQVKILIKYCSWKREKRHFPLFYCVKTGKNGITVFYSLMVVKKHESDACSTVLYNWDKWGYFEHPGGLLHACHVLQ